MLFTKDKTFRAHRVILSASLAYFRAAFNVMPGGNQQVILFLRDYKAKSVEPFLTLAYTGKMLLTDENIVIIFKQALDFKEKDVVEACIKYLTIHLKLEQACEVYLITKINHIISLKELAKSMISSHFKECSNAQEFLNLNFEDLMDIMSQAVVNDTLTNKVFFNRIVLWLLHDSSKRQMHVYSLLKAIEIKEFSENYLLMYIDKRKEDHRSIGRDIIYCYNQQMEQKLHSYLLRQHGSLIAVGKVRGNFQVQYYAPFLKKWYESSEFIVNLNKFMVIGRGCIFNKKFYCLIVDKSCPLNNQVQLVECDMLTSPKAILNSSCELLRSSTICASSKCIYLCGGMNRDQSVSDCVIRYIPQTKVFETLLPMPTKRCAPAVTFAEGCLYVLGGINESAELLDAVEVYDTRKKEWSQLESLGTPRAGFAAAVLEEKLYVAGGVKDVNDKLYYTPSVQVYSSKSGRWQPVASMPRKRLRFAMIAYKGKLLTAGGNVNDTSNKTIDLYDPQKDEWKEDGELSVDLKFKRPVIQSC